MRATVPRPSFTRDVLAMDVSRPHFHVRPTLAVLAITAVALVIGKVTGLAALTAVASAVFGVIFGLLTFPTLSTTFGNVFGKAPRGLHGGSHPIDLAIITIPLIALCLSQMVNFSVAHPAIMIVWVSCAAARLTIARKRETKNS